MVKGISKRLRDCIRQLENGKRMNPIILKTIRRVLLQRRTIYTLPMAAHSTTIQHLAHNFPAVSQDQSVSDDTSKAKHTMIHIYQTKSRAQTPIIIHQNCIPLFNIHFEVLEGYTYPLSKHQQNGPNNFPTPFRIVLL